MRLANPDPEPRQSEDELPTRRLLVIAAVTLLVFAVGVLGSTWIWARGGRGDSASGPERVPPPVGSPEIGMVFQPTFDQFADGQALQERQRARLRSYGWIDRRRGIVHVPVDQGIDRYLEARPR